MFKKEKFIYRITRDAKMNLECSREQKNNQIQGTICSYSMPNYLRIVQYLDEINEVLKEQNMAISINDKRLKEREIRIFYLNNPNPED